MPPPLNPSLPEPLVSSYPMRAPALTDQAPQEPPQPPQLLAFSPLQLEPQLAPSRPLTLPLLAPPPVCSVLLE